MSGCKFHTYVENMVQKILIAQPSTGVEEQAAVAAVIKSGMLTRGPVVTELCRHQWHRTETRLTDHFLIQ